MNTRGECRPAFWTSDSALTFGYESFFEISLILIVASFAIPISRKASVVDIPILIFLGILLGPVTGIISHGFLIYLMTQFGGVGLGMLGIVIILYYESHSINFRIIRREFMRIAMLDTLGVVITTIVSAFLFSFVTGAPLIIGFLFGAAIAPTDPASLIPLFRNISMKEEVSGTLVGESIFNDPISIILIALGISIVAPSSNYVPVFQMLSQHISLILTSVLFFLIEISIPALIGILVGFSVIYLNRVMKFDNLLFAFTLGILILEFTLLEVAGLTPFPAVIATGAIIGNFTDKSLFWQREESFQQSLSFLARAIIFFALGSILIASQVETYFYIGIILAAGVLFFARPIAVFASLLVSDIVPQRFKMNNRIKSFIALVGPRGVVSIVVSLIPYTIGLENNIPSLIMWGPLIYVATSFVVIISIVVQTIYFPYVSRKLVGIELK